jgi:hypothetical protein
MDAGIRHGCEVRVESLYEAAAKPSKAFAKVAFGPRIPSAAGRRHMEEVMADIAKTLEGRALIFVAKTPRADRWMQQRFGAMTQRFGKHAIAFRTDRADQSELAGKLEADALALEPALEFETVVEKLLISR